MQYYCLHIVHKSHSLNIWFISDTPLLSESTHAAKIKTLKDQVVKAVDGKNFEKAEELNAKLNELTEKAKNSTKVLKNEGIEILSH